MKEIKEFKELCDLNNIELITIMFPQFFNVYLSYNQNEIESFKKQLVKITPFHDFYLLADYTFDERYWYDTSHFVPSIGNKIINDTFQNKNLITVNNIEKNINDSRKLLSNLLNKDGIGISKFNENIELKDLSLLFDIKQNNYSKNNQIEISIKNDFIELNNLNTDPIIILDQTKADSKNVILSYEINSKIDTIFQLFYKKEKNSNYNEIDSYRVALNKGNNKINLLIPSEYINNDLRVDLVSNIGDFEIIRFKIYTN